MLAKDTQLGQFEDRFAKSEIGQDLACSHCLTRRQGQGFPPCRAKPAENRIWAAAKTFACRTQSNSKAKSLNEGNIQAVVLIYDNLLLKGTQIQSWWLVPLNCAPPYNNADIVCSGQLALPDVRLASVGEDARVPVGQLPVPQSQVGVAVLVHLHHRLLLRVSLGASEVDGLVMDQYLQLHDI